MPNGHGGAPFLGAPILFAILFVVVAWAPPDTGFLPDWFRASQCASFAAVVGWRLAYHLHLRHADEYGGLYTEPEVYKLALRRYWLYSVLYAAVTTSVGLGIVWCRGLL